MATHNICCPLCASTPETTFLERDAIPVHQHVVCSSQQEAREFPKGQLRCMVCDHCGFVFNAGFKPEYLSYNAIYDNSNPSSYFATYMEDLARVLKAKYHLSAKNVLEIGSGKGAFLKMLCSQGENRGVGFDPSYVGPDTDGSIHFVRSFFSSEQVPVAPDFVCCRHVIEHIQELPPLLRSVRAAIDGNSEAVVYFETPDLNWILEQTAFWDFFYEHCSYYTAATLSYAFEKCGFEVIDVYPTFQGQYLGIEARVRRGNNGDAASPPANVPELRHRIQQFVSSAKEKVDRCESQVRHYHKTGGCAIWGAGAKGMTFANIIDPDARLIQCLVDINPVKQGRFVAGSGHAIIAPSQLLDASVAGLVNMNPNYLEENQAMVQQMRLGTELISA